jgi:hypothetical protein
VKIALGLAAAFALALPGAAIADDGKNEDKVICKRDRMSDTGSNIRTRGKTCMKASEWEALEQRMDHSMRRIQDKMRGGPAPVSGVVGGPQ